MKGRGHVIKALHVRSQLQVCCALQGMTPLHHAATRGNVQYVQALLEHGADIHAQATIDLVMKVSPCCCVSNIIAGLPSRLSAYELHTLQW